METDEIERALRAETEGTTWLLGDHVLLRADNPYYDEAVKALVRELAAEPDSLGLDGQTFAVRLP